MDILEKLEKLAETTYKDYSLINQKLYLNGIEALKRDFDFLNAAHENEVAFD